MPDPNANGQPPLWFPSDDPLVPFALPPGGQMPLWRENDPEHLKPQEQNKGFARVFDFGKPEDVAEYNRVVNTCAKGAGQLCVEERTFFEGRFLIYARWTERYYATNKQVQQGATRDPNSGQLTFSD